MSHLKVGRLSLKVIITGALVLLLLIPAALIKDVVEERQERRKEAILEMGSRWGLSQVVGGPVLVVPYYVSTKTGREKRWMVALPRELKIQARLEAEKRARGIFDSAVYRAHIRLSGQIVRESFESMGSGANPDWSGALLVVGISDMQGIEKASFTFNNRPLTLRPGANEGKVFSMGLYAPTQGQLSGLFEGEIQLRGSEMLRFALAGQKTSLKLEGNWPDPSFDGRFLPATRRIQASGFEANWELDTILNRNFPRSWTTETENAEMYASELLGSASGLSLFMPVDIYQKASRSIKYAGMFIALVFLAYFLFEVLLGLSIHPIQYLLLGGAKVIFYLLLLSLSEHMGFARAYAVAAIASVAQITFYSGGVLKSARRALWMTGILSGIYGYLYSLLQMQDHALLIGSIGLFLVLGAVMYLTRKISWYNQDQSGPETVSSFS